VHDHKKHDTLRLSSKIPPRQLVIPHIYLLVTVLSRPPRPQHDII